MLIVEVYVIMIIITVFHVTVVESTSEITFTTSPTATMSSTSVETLTSSSSAAISTTPTSVLGSTLIYVCDTCFFAATHQHQGDILYFVLILALNSVRVRIYILNGYVPSHRLTLGPW